MKKLKRISLLATMILTVSLTQNSCKTGEGCDNTAAYQSQVENFENTKKRGKSNLFSKKQRKKMKK